MRDANLFDEARQVCQAALQMMPDHPEFKAILGSLPKPKPQKDDLTGHLRVFAQMRTDHPKGPSWALRFFFVSADARSRVGPSGVFIRHCSATVPLEDRDGSSASEFELAAHVRPKLAEPSAEPPRRHRR